MLNFPFESSSKELAVDVCYINMSTCLLSQWHTVLMADLIQSCSLWKLSLVGKGMLKTNDKTFQTFLVSTFLLSFFPLLIFFGLIHFNGCTYMHTHLHNHTCIQTQLQGLCKYINGHICWCLYVCAWEREREREKFYASYYICTFMCINFTIFEC